MTDDQTQELLDEYVKIKAEMKPMYSRLQEIKKLLGKEDNDHTRGW